MPRKRRPRSPFVRITKLLARLQPKDSDPNELIAARRVLANGSVVMSADAFVRRDAAITVRCETALRGEAKLRAALARFGSSVAGRVALDVGAAAGGFTKVLLEAGATRVYAVDVGHGQLRGSLRCDPLVVNLEATNLATLGRDLVPDVIAVVTIDLSYLSVAGAVPQLERLAIADDADLVALVKPMFEKRLAEPPTDARLLVEAVHRAVVGIEAAGWTADGWMESPVTGARAAVEFFVHARRRTAVGGRKDRESRSKIEPAAGGLRKIEPPHGTWRRQQAPQPTATAVPMSSRRGIQGKLLSPIGRSTKAV